MLLIDQGGRRVRKVCDRCHGVRVAGIKRGVCADCRRKAWVAEVRYRRRMNQMFGDTFYKITHVRRRRA